MPIKAHEIVLIATLIGLLIIGCSPNSAVDKANADTSSKFFNGEVQLFKTAPDGTQLWRVWDGGRTVYFSSTGTQTANGKAGESFVPHRDHPSIVIR